uniref:Uncharacterized protein n=1 Tax=Panagrolaimus sp. PS1159 TaxID=55785 RepID=A0AC35FSL2_9BILA
MLLNGIESATNGNETKASTTKAPAVKANVTKAQIPVTSLLSPSINDDYMKLLDIYHIDNKCQMARFGYNRDFYKIGLHSNDFITYADLLPPKESCPRKTHAMIVSNEGQQYYDASLIKRSNNQTLKINTYKIPFYGDTKRIEGEDHVGIDAQDLEDLSNCFEDLGSFYCVATRSEDDIVTPTVVLLRFAKRGNGSFEHVGNYKMDILHGGMPRNILQDSQSGEIAIIYKPFGGHEDQSFDVRSIFDLGKRGKLIRGNYPVHQTIGIGTHRGYRFFVVYRKDTAENKKKPYTFYRAPTDFPVANKEVAKNDWGDLQTRSARRINMFFKDSIPDQFLLAKFFSQSCQKLVREQNNCKEEYDSIKSLMIILIIIASILMVIFILLVALLLVYILVCIKPKRRHRKRRKHRKHMKRKDPTEISTKPEEEVEVEPGKPEEEEKPEDNKVVQKLKELGAVDYSSSSSEDPEHSQAYYSARDKFDTNASTAQSDGAAPPATAIPNYENLGPSAAGDPTSTTGAVPEEHDMADKAGGKPAAPRSVYMKPKKKKK